MDILILWAIIFFQTGVLLRVLYAYMHTTQPSLPSDSQIDSLMSQQFVTKILRDSRNQQKIDAATKDSDEIAGFVYVIKETGLNKFYKIGMTTTIIGRLAALETAMPYPMEIIGIYPCNRFADLETTLHRLYHRQRRKNEWFELEDSDLQNINQLCLAWKD